ncbi:MAG TPA: preprotein translocase subunit SecE [Firmicutes bacterium]|nr:preprotein translocase subunit SecE [Bacillales bacterium]HJA41637.1 preprotein translocase subunit SecE [Bacillota bacterium]
MRKIVGFLKDVSREMKKVSWPKGKDLFRYTVVVLTTIVAFSLFFFVTDILISRVIDFVLK